MAYATAGSPKMITDEEYKELREKVIKSFSQEEIELLLIYEMEDELKEIIKEIRC